MLNGRWQLWLMILMAACACACSCGDDSDSESGGTGDDSGAQDDDSSVGDDSQSADDTRDDTGGDDTADDDSGDDTQPDDDTGDDSTDDDDTADDDDDTVGAYYCHWNADLTEEPGYEWVVSRVYDEDPFLLSPLMDLAFEDDLPVVVYSLGIDNGQRIDFYTYVARPKNGHFGPNPSDWKVELVSGAGDFEVFELELDQVDGVTEVAFLGRQGWTGKILNVCRLDGFEFVDCEGVTDESKVAIHFDHTPNGRPAVTFGAFSGDSIYAEKTAQGGWAPSLIPGGFAYGLAVGPDGVAHTTTEYFYWDGQDLLARESHMFGRTWEVWQDDIIFEGPPPIMDYVKSISVNSLGDLAAATYTNEITYVLLREGVEPWTSIAMTGQGHIDSSSARVSFDADDRSIAAYTSGLYNQSYLCWARKEGNQWRKELVYGRDASVVYGLESDSDGNIGVLNIVFDGLKFSWRHAVSQPDP